MGADAPLPGACQQRFLQRWPTLRDPHVRALAWLLDAPDLLDVDAARWEGRIARLPDGAADDCRDWLLQLDAAPAELHGYLGVHRFTRLGRYAENLLAWYFRYRGILFAHGLQVRAGPDATVGEFDFLIRHGESLLHWEFATKFYLLHSDDPAMSGVQQADYFVGPNLADTLGRKMRKILERQLRLGEHPAAQALLPRPPDDAQALVKGWLFYRRGETPPWQASGVSAAHCRGWWCTLRELGAHLHGNGAVIPRIGWLAPARLPLAEGLGLPALTAMLEAMFAQDPTPVMVAQLQRCEDGWVETDRGFVVPDAWPAEAGRRLSAQAPLAD